MIDQAKSWVGPGATANLPGRLDEPPAPRHHEHQQRVQRVLQPDRPAAPPTGSINFYRSGTSGTNVCRNTGEIPAVFDHEWGHGLDSFDDIPGVTLPGEAYADMTGILRLNGSCFGRGFFVSNALPAETAPATATSAPSAPACARSTG